MPTLVVELTVTSQLLFHVAVNVLGTPGGPEHETGVALPSRYRQTNGSGAPPPMSQSLAGFVLKFDVGNAADTARIVYIRPNPDTHWLLMHTSVAVVHSMWFWQPVQAPAGHV